MQAKKGSPWYITEEEAEAARQHDAAELRARGILRTPPEKK